MSGRGEPDDIVQYGNDGDDDEDTASARSSGRREAPLSQHRTCADLTAPDSKKAMASGTFGKLRYVCLFVCLRLWAFV